MTNQDATPRDRRMVIIAVLAGIVLLAGGVVAGIMLSRGGGSAAATTTTVAPPATTLPPPTTTIPPPTTTTVPPPPENQVIFPVVEDTFVDNEEPDEIKGALDVIEIELDGEEIERALIRFEVSGLPDGEPIASAALRMSQTDESEQAGTVSLVDGPWSEAETTWTTAPPVGQEVTAIPAGGDEGVVEIDVTEAITGNGTYDFYLSTPSEATMEYASKESGQGAALVVVWGEVDQTVEATLVGAGDIASCDSQGDEITAGLIGEVAADAQELVVFTAGDNAYESGSLEDFNNCYAPSWGQFKDVTRPAAGAREYRTDGAAGHFAYFGSAAGEVGEGYYSYDLAGWHIVVLNSNCEQVGGCEQDSPQGQWLRQDLETSSAACTLGYWHHPLFSSSPSGGNTQVLPLVQALYEADAEIVINADNHFYERFQPQTPEGAEDDEGIHQFTVGTGGRSLDNFGEAAELSAVQFNDEFGVLAFTLTPGGYEWSFVTPPGGEFTDAGTGTCH